MSWPFATRQTLTALANLLNNQTQGYVTARDYFALLKTYTKSQFKNGHPYIAEALNPDTGSWTYDTPNHSEHYTHSTYNDLIITKLLGVRPRPDDMFEVNPLIPRTGGPSTHLVSVTGGPDIPLTCPPTAAWGDFTSRASVTLGLTLTAGRDSIVFTHSDQYAELDRIDLS